MTNESLYTLGELSELTGISPETIMTKRKRGTIPAVQIENGKRKDWRYPENALEILLGSQKDGQYEKLYSQWIDEQTNGLFTSTKKPLSLETIKNNEYGMAAYWERLGLKPSIKAIHADNLRTAMASVGIDHENKNCHFAVKDKIYTSIVSFSKLLVRSGIQSQKDFEDIRSCKQAQLYPKKQTIIRNNELDKILQANEILGGNRSDYDKLLTRTLILTLAYTGMRRAEIIAVHLEHFNLSQKEIFISCGKGAKARRVGICPLLEGEIRKYLRERPNSSHTNIFLQDTGKPITEYVLRGRIDSLEEKTGIINQDGSRLPNWKLKKKNIYNLPESELMDLLESISEDHKEQMVQDYRQYQLNKIECSNHTFRRYFATWLAEMGFTLPEIQILMGHSEIKTTMNYIKPDMQRALDNLKNVKQKAPLVVTPERLNNVNEETFRQPAFCF